MVGIELETHRLHGDTFKEFCVKLFEYEYCYECEGDAENHTPGILLGNWVAICKGLDNKCEYDAGSCGMDTGGDNSGLCLYHWSKVHNMDYEE